MQFILKLAQVALSLHAERQTVMNVWHDCSFFTHNYFILKTFEELGVNEEIRRAIEELGFEQPMPVQEEVIPYLLGNRNDVIALAQTGTGKTAAFGIPVLQRIDSRARQTQALILSPTRELCLQIADDLKDFSKYVSGINIVPVYGGTSIENQIRALKHGAQIIVATPGRLIDLMHRGAAKLEAVKNVVLDEADEMLNMGFSESIDEILAGVPKDRNTLLFSATMSKEIEKIARNYLHDPKEIVVGSRNEGAEHVNHIYYMVSAKDKYLALKRIVDYYPKIFAIIFCRTKRETQEIADKLIHNGYNAESLHGDLSQQQRDLTMQKFRQHLTQLLVATDVAARGLDVDDLTHVINYGLPDDTESYTHRSGRTGRAGKTGTSIAIINLREKGRIREIERIIGKKFEPGVMPTAKQICEKQLLKVIDDLEKVKVNEEEIADFMPDVCRKLDWLSKEDLIKRMVSHEFNRFAEYYRDREEIETVSLKEEKKAAKDGKGKKSGSRKAEEGFTRLFINIGKTDNFFPNDLIGLINSNTKGRVDLGRIDLMRNFSFFEVDETEADTVIKALNRTRWNGRKVSVERAGEADEKDGKKKKKDGRSEGGKPETKKAAKPRAEKPAKEPKRTKPSREERGYTKPRGRKDDWKQFFQHNNDLKGAEPDFSEEGWAKPSKKKKK